MPLCARARMLLKFYCACAQVQRGLRVTCTPPLKFLTDDTGCMAGTSEEFGTSISSRVRGPLLMSVCPNALWREPVQRCRSGLHTMRKEDVLEFLTERHWQVPAAP